MLFAGDRFCPEAVGNGRVRQLLVDVLSDSIGPLKPSVFLASAVRREYVEVAALLAQGLPVELSVTAIFQRAERDGAAASNPPTDPRMARVGAFDPAMLAALTQFDAALEKSNGQLDLVALELLVLCIVNHLDEAERRLLRPFDPRRAMDACRAAIDAKLNDEYSGVAQGSADDDGQDPSNDETMVQRLQQFVPCADLTQRAASADTTGPFPFDGASIYERVFAAIARVLHRRTIHHLFLVGERGVGKSTIVTELARRALTGRWSFLARARFLVIDARFIPPDESRQCLNAIFGQLKHASDLVLAIDGLAALLRGERGAGNKPVFLAEVARSRCQVIGLLTPREYEDLIADDPDYAEFFSRVDVPEPDVDTALKLLEHFAASMAQKFDVVIEPEAVRQAVVLSANYVLNDQLPSKAVKILQRVCEDIDFERGKPEVRERVTPDNVVGVVSELSGVPAETLRGIADRTDYEESLREVIFGQDEAVREVATELGLIKAGMTDPDKPASVMLFLGQTGTGKTEMAKALARFYSTSKRLKTYTLGNCVEPHSVATIIGVPPGYVGNDRGGRLVNELNSDPYCVFLLDEADKAHPDVLQPFLNLFDEGWVADQRGVRGYADKSIFIMTTNVGQRMIAELYEQKKPREEIAARMKEALSQIRHTKSDRPVFTPEFLARIKRVIVFSPLDETAMKGIARKLTSETIRNWSEKRGKRLEIPVDLVERIAAEAHRLNEQAKGKEGGRIVRKLLADWVEGPLQRAVSSQPDDYRRCTSVRIHVTQAERALPADQAPAAPVVAVQFA